MIHLMAEAVINTASVFLCIIVKYSTKCLCKYAIFLAELLDFNALI